MASFVSGVYGVTFDVDADTFREQRENRVAVQEIPGGDSFYVDLAGRHPLSWRFGIVLASSDLWNNLNAAMSAPTYGAGTLTVEGMNSHAVVLMNLGRPAPFVDGKTRAETEFLITDT